MYLIVFSWLISFLHADLRVGIELSYPPFEMVCPQGQPCGISVDIAEALGRFLHRKAEIENIGFIGLIPSLKNGRIDLIISSLTVTEQRKKSIDFSEPYGSIGLCLLANVHSTLTGIEGANTPERIIVVKSGTSGENYALTYLDKATVRVLDKEAQCVLEIVQGKADAFIYDQLSVYTNWQKNPTTTKPILTPFQIEKWAVGIRKGNERLRSEVNQFIETFRQEGGFAQLGEKYLLEQKTAFQKLGVPFVF